jgi:hypothetical protein
MAEYSFDLTPDIVDFTLYAGDTLAFNIEFTSDEFDASGLNWLSQIRDTRDATEVAAEFIITPLPNGADMLLPGSVTGALVNQSGVMMSARQLQERYPKTLATLGAEKMLVFVAAWDVQVAAPDGTDPVVTLAQGEIVIGLDVSREALP